MRKKRKWLILAICCKCMISLTIWRLCEILAGMVYACSMMYAIDWGVLDLFCASFLCMQDACRLEQSRRKFIFIYFSIMPCQGTICAWRDLMQFFGVWSKRAYILRYLMDFTFGMVIALWDKFVELLRFLGFVRWGRWGGYAPFAPWGMAISPPNIFFTI